MSVRRDERSPFYAYQFKLAGRRFYGSTKCEGKREAQAFERDEKARQRKLIDAEKTAKGSLRLEHVLDRYWQTVGQHHADSATTWGLMTKVHDFFGGEKSLAEMTDSDIVALIAWRRAHKNKRGQALSPFTVNDTVEQVKKLFKFVREKERTILPDEPIWGNHWLEVPQEREAELSGEEYERLHSDGEEGYGDLVRYANLTGARLKECLLRWSDVRWDLGQIVTTGKKGRTVRVPITSEVRALLWPLRSHHAEFVFTFVAGRRRRKGQARGQRYPVTYHSAKKAWQRQRAAAGLGHVRFHDLRHDFASKLLRATGNLKLTAKALNHAGLRNVGRYAHVLDGEVAAAVGAMQRTRGDAKVRKKVRKNLAIVA